MNIIIDSTNASNIEQTTDSQSTILNLNATKMYLEELLNFDWTEFTYRYRLLVTCYGISDEFKKQTAKHLIDQLNFLSESLQTLLVDCFRDECIHKRLLKLHSSTNKKQILQENLAPLPKLRDILNNYSNSPSVDMLLSEDILDLLNKTCILVCRTTESISKKRDLSYFQGVYHFFYGYSLVPNLFWSANLTMVDFFTMLGDYLFRISNNPSRELRLQYKKILNRYSSGNEFSIEEQLLDDLLAFLSNVPHTRAKRDENDKFIQQAFVDSSACNTISEFIRVLQFSLPLNCHTLPRAFDRMMSTCDDWAFKYFCYNYLDSISKEKKSTKYVCNSLIEFICGSILLCYTDRTPIMECFYCGNFFIRSSNSQKTCKKDSCMNNDASSSNVKIKKAFGEYAVKILPNASKRIKFKTENRVSIPGDYRFCSCGLSEEDSKTIVETLGSMINAYQKTLREYAEYALSLPEFALITYSEAVEEWLDKIDVLYHEKEIQRLIDQEYGKPRERDPYTQTTRPRMLQIPQYFIDYNNCLEVGTKYVSIALSTKELPMPDSNRDCKKLQN